MSPELQGAPGAAARDAEISDDDPRLVRALEEYLFATERGRRPDRAEFLARHAPIAAALASSLDMMDLVRSAAPDFDPAADAAPPPQEVRPRSQLGDFRVVREVGRGGMGIVYEAEQISLGRRVALKVLPFSAALDPRQRQRFQVEAQAAAHLHHPHIVPVYSVGNERGVHFYAMQFVEGPSLADLIDELRRRPRRPLDAVAAKGRSHGGPDSTVDLRPCSSRCASSTIEGASATTDGAGRDLEYFRSVARVGVQAAEALEHAHALGVVHRDVKPANLMLDAAGKLWVTDFGLARFQDDGELTRSGDLLGTLRYMSPEQAQARRVVLDHRTDIYSLGVTLYELLALRPAFDAKDRNELLRQIAQDEPVAPRRIDATIPRDLETVVQKAMSKEVSGRYATAQELADDLSRFLDDRPIQARRPTPPEAAVRWARRHKPVVRAAAVMALVLTLGSIVSTLLIWRAKRDTEAALLAERRQRESSEARLESLLEAGSGLTLLAGEFLPRDPRGEEAVRDRLRKVLSFQEKLADTGGASPGARWRTAVLYGKIGDLNQELGQDDKAEQAYDKARALLEGLAGESPATPAYRRHLATSLNNLGALMAKAQRWPEAGRAHARALAIQQRLAEDAPADPALRQEMARSHGLLGKVQAATNEVVPMQTHLGRAIELHRGLVDQFPANPDYRLDLARTYNSLGDPLRTIGHYRQAEELSQQALGLLEPLAAADRDNPAIREQLAISLYNLGNALKSSGRDREAADAYDRAEPILAGLARDFPSVPRYRQQRAAVHSMRGVTMIFADNRREADKSLRLALEMDPNNAVAHNNLAWLLVTRPGPSLYDPAQAVALAKKAIALAPRTDPSCHTGLYLNTLGVAYARLGDWKAARAALEEAMRLRAGGDPNDWLFLAMACWHQGDREQARRWYERSVAWVEQNKVRDPFLEQFRREADALLGPAAVAEPARAPAPPLDARRVRRVAGPFCVTCPIEAL